MPALRCRGSIFITAVAFVLICILFHAQGVPELICPPGIIEVGTSAAVSCSTSTANVTLKYIGPSGKNAVQCDMKIPFCSNIQDHNASALNETHTELQVNKVQPIHGGNWVCQDLEQSNNTKDSCSMAVRQTPSCKIESDSDASALSVHETISLIMDIVDFYCSSASNFTLQTGRVREFLNTSTHINTTRNETFKIKLKTTDSHFGKVRLIFGCHNEELNVTCRGIDRFEGGKCPTALVVLATVSIPLLIIITSSIIIYLVKRNRKSSLGHHHSAGDVSDEDSIELSEDPSVSLRDEALKRAMRNVDDGDGVYSLAK